MKGLYLWSRLLAGFFGFTTLLGILWFSGSQGKVFVTAALVMGFSSLLASFISPRALSSSKAASAFVTMLCVAGVGGGFVLITDDFSATDGIEWHVIAIRLLHIGALGILAGRALKLLPEPT